MSAATATLPTEESLSFRIEAHGTDHIPRAERWARPRDLGAMWAGASINAEYFVYGAILMSFGFSLPEAVGLIVVGNLSWLLVGLCSLQGPTTGTTTLGVNRAPFGPRGSRGIALLNWLTLIGFEVEGLILIVGSGLVLLDLAGLSAGPTTKALVVVAAVAVQAILPVFGHATITRVLRWLVIPFVLAYGLLATFAIGHAHLPAASPHGWQAWTIGLAFSITLSGLSWTECGNDYSRYLPADASPRATVGWVFLGTALPQVLVMSLGAVVVTFIGTTAGWNGANPFVGFAHQHVLPTWFAAAFMAMIGIQLLSINSLDLYSSGVTLQALGVRLRRHQAVLLDSALCLAITLWAVFSASFSTLLRDFVSLVIVWIAPWCAIYLVDWWLRSGRYSPSGLQRTDRGSLYWATEGISIPAVVAQLVGMAVALASISTTVPLPRWLNPIAQSTGADLSLPLAMGASAIVYVVLAKATGLVDQQQAELLAAES